MLVKAPANWLTSRIPARKVTKCSEIPRATVALTLAIPDPYRLRCSASFREWMWRVRLALRGLLPLDHAGFRGDLGVRHPIDIAVMFLALWLLGSMVVDILTPKELTFYLIAAATGPAAFGTALCYLLRVPKIDFAMIVTALWLVASMAIELLSPLPLPDYMIPGALIPPIIVGAVLHWHRYRLRQAMQTQKRPADPEEATDRPAR